VVRTDFGSLDARIDAQLSEIKQALLQVYTAEQGVEEE
jgi:flagellar biosynthesis/type III secretory pathway protein FliH